MSRCALLMTLAASALVAFSATASAQAVGAWRVSGDISGRQFIVECKFDPQTGGFGGTCVDAATGEASAKPGKAHQLSMGAFDGKQIRWVYSASMMFMPMDVAYVGTLEGNRINGTVSAAGRKGNFTASRH
jgi:hypothetical protein